MRPFRPGKKVIIPLIVVFAGLLTAWISQRNAGNSPPVAVEPADKPAKSPGLPSRRAEGFDFYLLAMTLHPAFCADGHAREPECRIGEPVPLSIHGLWPERLAPGKYPRDCQGPPLSLDHGLELELAPLMPGMADNLHDHEWRAHGRCSGLDDDEYFRHTLDLALVLDRVLRAKLTTLAGEATTAGELRAYADSYQSGLGATLTFHCRTLRNAPSGNRNEPYLVEIRQCVDDDGARGAPATLMNCASVNRRDQGCGKGFRIAEVSR